MTQPTFVSTVFYREPLAALKWLEAAFGFETTSLVTDAEGKVGHSQMEFHGGAINVGGEWQGPPLGPAKMRSPASLDGVGTQFIRIHLTEGLDAHCEEHQPHYHRRESTNALHDHPSLMSSSRQLSAVGSQLRLPPGPHGATFCLMLYNASHGRSAHQASSLLISWSFVESTLN